MLLMLLHVPSQAYMMLTRCGQTGMLGSVETIDVLSDMIEKHNLTTVVVDPVRPRPNRHKALFT